jgi:ribosomal protein L11 methyltransferase
MLREFTIVVGETHAEPLADALLQAGALSVAVEDAEAGTAGEQALFGEPGFEPERAAWHSSRLIVLVDAGADPSQVLARACEAIALDVPPAIESLRTVADADWVRLTQAQFAPVQVSPRMWIVPSWHTPPGDAQIVIRLDPGVAFGTGTHPTTRLCLQWLDAHPLEQRTVLDYGCGSGVLAIAAAKLGAREVVGIDIDPQAVEAARLNSAANLAGSGVTADYTCPDALAPARRFDVVLANILSNPLKVLAPALTARVAPAGALVLSGVLARQSDELIAAYRAADASLALVVWREDDGWACIAGRRRG